MSAELDQIFSALDVEVEAFAMCEIGRSYSLVCAPHDDTLLHFVLAGEGYLECQGGRYDLRSGSLVAVPPRTEKTLNGRGPIRHVRAAEPVCNLTEGIVRFSAGDQQPDLLLGCAVLKLSIGRCVPLLGELQGPLLLRTQDPSARALYEAMLSELRAPREGTRAFLSAIMKQVLILALRAGGSERLLSPHMADPHLQRAANLVLRKPFADYTVRLLADEARMSRTRFSEHFLSAYGCSPMAFVQSVRLESAATLLKTSQLAVKGVAASVGYASRSQFSKAFRKRFGMDPSAYREASRT